MEALQVGQGFKVVIKGTMKLWGDMARAGMENEVDQGGMLRRFAEVAANA